MAPFLVTTTRCNDAQTQTDLDAYFFYPDGDVVLQDSYSSSSTPCSTVNSRCDDKIKALAQQVTILDAHLVNHYPKTYNNNVNVLINGTEVFPKIFHDIQQAQHSIHINYFRFENDTIGNHYADLLISKAKQGISVRVVIDWSGSSFRAKKIIEKMRRGGIEVICNHGFWPRLRSKESFFTPPDHRKIVVVDGQTGYLGGLNVADDYVSRFHDVMLRFEGECVGQLQLEWCQTWLQLGGKLDTSPASLARYFKTPATPVGSADIQVVQGLPGHNQAIKQLFLHLIETAKQEILLQVPYLTNQDMLKALITAAHRGVQVTVILPEKNDSRIVGAIHHYWGRTLQQAGVQVFEYPGFTHAKTMVVDNAKLTLGTSNADGLSFDYIRECNIASEDKTLIQEIKTRLFEADLRICKPMQVSDSLFGKLKNMLAWLLANIV